MPKLPAQNHSILNLNNATCISKHNMLIIGFGSKFVSSSDCPDEVVADDFCPYFRFYGFYCFVSY